MFLRVGRIPRSTPLGRRAGLIGLGLLVAGLNTGNNLFYLFFTLLAAAELVGFLAAGSVLRRTRIEVGLPRRGRAGAPLRVSVRVSNGSRWVPLPPLRWRLRTTRGEDVEVATPAVAPGGDGAGFARMVPAERGRMRVEATEVRTDFPFGLSERRARAAGAEAETLVVPRPLRARPSRSSRRSGDARSSARPRGAGEEPADAREYRVGDDARRIDWKATARTERLIYRERRGAIPTAVEVRLDRSGPPGRAFEDRVSRAAGAAADALARGVPFALRSDERELPPRSGALQYRRVLEYLAEVSAAGDRRRTA